MVIPGPVIDSALGAVLGIVAAALAFFLLRRSAKLAIGLWLAVVSLLPVWVGVSFGFGGNFYLPLASIVAVIVILALLPVRRFAFHLIDALVGLLWIVGVAALFTGNTGIALSFLFTLVAYFSVGYILGRSAPARLDLRWLYGAVGVMFTVVAILAIIEFATRWNLFVQLSVNNSAYIAWGQLQERGGVLRAEGAFGHSIALGSSLAIAVPLTLASRFRFPIRGVMVLVMLLATVLTFSRIGMIGALLGLVLSVLFLREAFPERGRIALATAVTVASLGLFPIVATVFTDAGTEASGSAAYRGDLLSLLGDMNLIGLSDSARRTADGQVYFGNFRSIDSQLILTGLSSGTLVLAVALIALAAAVILVLRRRASAATIAVVAQIPALATVALITQYAILVWFVIGLAVASQVAIGGHATIPAHDGRQEFLLRDRPSNLRESAKKP